MLSSDVRPKLALTLWRDESAQDPSLFVIAESSARIFLGVCELW